MQQEMPQLFKKINDAVETDAFWPGVSLWHPVCCLKCLSDSRECPVQLKNLHSLSLGFL